MPYSLARYTRLFLLVPLGIVCMNPPVYSENSGSVHDGLCNYCAEHSSGDLSAGKISTSYVPILGFTERTSLARSATVLSKPEMRSEKPLLFVDTGISVSRSESVVDLLFKNIRLGKKPEMRSEKPLLFVDTGISVRRSESVVDLLFKNIRLGKKPEMRSEKPLLFVDTGISVRRSESVADLLFKNIRLGNTRSNNDGLCNYCENYLAGNMTADRTETIYAPLSGYALDANSPSKRSLAGVAIY